MSATPKPSFETFLAAVKVGKGFKWPNEDDSDYVRLRADEIKTLRDDVKRPGYIKSYGGSDYTSSSSWFCKDLLGRDIMFTSQPFSSLLGGDPKKAKADELIAAAERRIRMIEMELEMAQGKLAQLIAKHRPSKGSLAAKKMAGLSIGAKKAPAKKPMR